MSVMTETASRLGLKDAELLRGRCYVDGQWIDADSGKTIDVTNPATGEKLGTVPRMGPRKPAARSRRPTAPCRRGAPRPPRSARQILRKWFDLMMANQEDLARS